MADGNVSGGLRGAPAAKSLASALRGLVPPTDSPAAAAQTLNEDDKYLILEFLPHTGRRQSALIGAAFELRGQPVGYVGQRQQNRADQFGSESVRTSRSDSGQVQILVDLGVISDLRWLVVYVDNTHGDAPCSGPLQILHPVGHPLEIYAECVPPQRIWAAALIQHAPDGELIVQRLGEDLGDLAGLRSLVRRA